MIRRSSLLALEVVLGLLATLALGVGLAWWRLSAGPVEIPSLKRQVEAQLTEARGGRPVAIERVVLAFGPGKSSLQLQARNVKALDAKGKELTRSSQVSIGVSLQKLLIGRISLVEADFKGGDVTVTNSMDGSAKVAFGPPGSPADITIPAPPPDETLEQRVTRILDGLESAFRPIGAGGDLRALSITDAKLTIIDEKMGGHWYGSDATFNLVRDNSKLRLRAAASLTGPRGAAPFVATIATDTKFSAASISVTVTGARLQALAPPQKLGPLKGLSAPVTFALSADLDRKAGVRRLDGDLAIGRGMFELGEGKLAIDGGRVRGRYDLKTDVLTLQEVALRGQRTRLKGQGSIKSVSAMFDETNKQPARFEIASPKVEFAMPGAFAAPLIVDNVTASGAVRMDASAVDFERFEATVESARINIAGQLYWGDDGAGKVRPGIKAAGRIDGVVSPATVLKFWPLELGAGARSWIKDAVLGGRVYNVALIADVKPSDIARGHLSDPSLSIKFQYDQASVRYIKEMTAITEGRGDAELKGNSFRLNATTAKIGDIDVVDGKVIIPQLVPKGAMATFAGRGKGSTRSMINLLRQAPLKLDERLPFDPATITGTGVLDFSIGRPMLSDVPAEKMKFAFDGDFDNAGGKAKSGEYEISQWRLNVSGDEKQLKLAGPLAIGKSKADLTWVEQFTDKTGSPSNVVLRGRLDAAELQKLGYDVFQYAKGPVGIELRSAGKGLDVNNGDIGLDFTAAALTLPGKFWTKAAGVPAGVKLKALRGADGMLVLQDFKPSGAGIVLSGQARVSPGGDLLDATLPVVKLPDSADAKVVVKRNAAGALDVTATGAFLNIGPFFAPEQNKPTAEGVIAPTPPVEGATKRLSPAFEIHAAVDKLRLRGGADLSAGKVDMSSDGKAMTRLVLSGTTPTQKAFAFNILPVQNQPGVGKVTFKSGDAGFTVRAFTGTENVAGGSAEATGSWKFAVNPSANLVVKLRDFKLVKMPAMTQLLSSVASLQGLVGMMNGDGIAFGGLEAPMTLAGNNITLGECRASGPSLGITAKGTVNLGNGTLNVDGVLVPSYGLNSVLGGVPVLGDLLVSRKGEGIFGLTYSLDGPAEKPRVGVNPLSVLTPGIFRRIFEPWSNPKPAPKESGG